MSPGDVSLGHGEDGRKVPITDFDYDSVDEALAPHPEIDISEFTQEEVDRALAVLRVLLQWVWQSGMKDPRGITIRAIIICWVFLKSVRPMTETQLATGFGLKKQSIGRWIDGGLGSFKKWFPRIRLPHMR